MFHLTVLSLAYSIQRPAISRLEKDTRGKVGLKEIKRTTRNLGHDVCSDRDSILGPRKYTSQALPLGKKGRKNEERLIPSFPKIIRFYVRF